jgi:hypothetical protein
MSQFTCRPNRRRRHRAMSCRFIQPANGSGERGHKSRVRKSRGKASPKFNDAKNAPKSNFSLYERRVWKSKEMLLEIKERPRKLYAKLFANRANLDSLVIFCEKHAKDFDNKTLLASVLYISKCGQHYDENLILNAKTLVSGLLTRIQKLG